MKIVAKDQKLFRLVVSMIAGLFLVFSQFTMSHAMSHMGQDYDCEASQISHCDSLEHVQSAFQSASNGLTTIVDGDSEHSSHHGNADHCATACLGALLPAVFDSSRFKLKQARLVAAYIEPMPAPAQGLKRPPKS